MNFDNNKALFNVMRVELIASIIFMGTFSISFLDIYKSKTLPLEGYQFALLIATIYFLLALIWYNIKYSYFSIDTTDGILIKYFRITPKFITPKPKMIKISKSTYVKYQIKKSFFGLRTALILFQKTKKGIVSYPPIYISGLNKDEIKKLKTVLQY